jgi:hypothetical protein
VLSARATVVCAPQIYWQRQPRQSAKPKSLWQQLTTNALIFSGSRSVFFAAAVDFPTLAASKNAWSTSTIPMLLPKTGATVLFPSRSSSLMLESHNIIYLYNIVLYFIIFGVLSRLFTFFSLYDVFKILSRTALDCSLFCPVRPIRPISYHEAPYGSLLRLRLVICQGYFVRNYCNT